MKHLPGYLLLPAIALLLAGAPWASSPARAEPPIQLAQRDVSVNGYVRSDGRYVQPHHQSAGDGNPYNNYGFPGNTNPYTGKVAPGNPDTYLRNYGGGSGSPYHTWSGLQTK